MQILQNKKKDMLREILTNKANCLSWLKKELSDFSNVPFILFLEGLQRRFNGENVVLKPLKATLNDVTGEEIKTPKKSFAQRIKEIEEKNKPIKDKITISFNSVIYEIVGEKVYVDGSQIDIENNPLLKNMISLFKNQSM
ncbi:hypothetical protein EDEG_02132 [Edhazardia aedis USNM 41457]|uniref:Uncharacterized protein n=1 Tax=Edhazardia aedis (strain USNM 41457) TaxID=1003232 RepID=J8ZV94_EDHAE|nr:hypothetical protein EDEG_02132 [Edhazardia aedis USNM 41457]|eukprot:EJW03548.1 hypothetical protein EDEG_02132 [Edhazardia aedis USNM 41457]